MTIMPMNRPPAYEADQSPFRNKRRGLFGSMTPDTPMTAEPAPMAAQQKPGFFGEGGVGRAIAGNIGDALLQYSGMQPIYQPAMAEQRELQRRAQEQQAQFQQQMQLADFKLKNREPTSFEQILDAAGITGDERIGLLRRKAENDAAGVPVGIDVQNADGSVTRQYVRPGTLGGGSSGPAVGAVEDGFRFKGGNPADKSNWEPVSASPPPVSAAPPRPNTIARSSYQAWVNQYGQSEADNIMRRNGFTVGNY